MTDLKPNFCTCETQRALISLSIKQTCTKTNKIQQESMKICRKSTREGSGSQKNAPESQKYWLNNSWSKNPEKTKIQQREARTFRV